MKTKHTPGPWAVGRTSNTTKDGTNEFIEVKSLAGDIARVWHPTVNLGTQESTEANAKLIAVAPDLLEALNDIVYAHDVKMGKTSIEIRIYNARLAIKKATS